MSLILDALNKADNERNQNSAPSITSNHDAAIIDSDESGNKKLIVLACVSALLLAAAIILYLVFNPSQQEPRESATSRIAQNQGHGAQAKLKIQRATTTDTTPKSASAPSKREKSKKIEALKERMIAAQYQKAVKEEEQTKNLALAQMEAEELQRLEENDEQVSAIYQQDQSPATTPSAVIAKKPVVTQKTTVSPTPRPRITPALSNTLAKHPLLSFIHDLPYPMQKSIPTMMYTRHKFRAGGDSFVKINNVEFRAGQQIAKNVYLEEILHDGIVVRFESRKFKLKALNSWVNM